MLTLAIDTIYQRAYLCARQKKRIKFKKVDKSVIKSLVEIVGKDNVLTEDFELIPYTCDLQWVKYPDLFSFKPEAVILPKPQIK